MTAPAPALLTLIPLHLLVLIHHHHQTLTAAQVALTAVLAQVKPQLPFICQNVMEPL